MPRACRDTSDRLLAIRITWLVSVVQLVSACIALGAAFVFGGVRPDRIAQTILMCAFGVPPLFLAGSSRDRRTLALLAWFACIGSIFARSAVHGLPVEWSSPIDFILRGIAPEAFAPACLWRFALDFPRVERFTSFDVAAGRITKAAWLLGTVLFLINVVGEHSPNGLGPLSVLLRRHPGDLFWHIWTVALVPAVFVLLWRSRGAPVPEHRKVLRFASAIAGGAAPYLLLDLLAALSPDIRMWLRNAGPAEHRWVDVTVIAALATMPFFATAAVIVDRPFEIHRISPRTSAYVVGRALLSSAYAAPVCLLLVTLYEQRHLSLAELLSGTSAIRLVVSAGTAWLLLVGRSRMLEAFDRLVSRRVAAHHAQLTRALERVRMARGVREAMAVLSTELRRGIGAERVTVLIADARGDFKASAQKRRRDAARTSEVTAPLSADSALVAVLHEMNSPLDLSNDTELVTLLPATERDWIAANDLALMTPMRHADGAIIAIVALGPKRGGLPFDVRDVWLIETLTNAAATVFDDAAESSSAHERSTAGHAEHEGDVAFECERCGLVGRSTALGCGCGAAPTLAALPIELGNTFIVQRRLGAGGMGVVYLARDTRLGRDVALKTLPERTPGGVTRLREEARAMAALNHEALATIYGLEQWRRTPVLVVEYLPNATLARTLVNGRLPRKDAVRLGITLTRALIYMHANGVLHRDLKPSNIGFSATGAPKLLDFGLASLIDARTGSTSAPPAGTTAYLPPEASHGASVSAAFDLWALSVVLFEVLTGSHPFATTHHPRDPDIALDADLTAFFRRTLALDPSRRFQAASTLLTALDALA